MVDSPGMSVAGIVDDPNTRSRVIPESRRADGSIRKERKVKPGFTPAEDIGRFRPSRVLRAQAEEAEAKKNGKIIPGYEPIQVEAARKAMEKTTISSPSSSTSTSSSFSRPSDGSWRRIAPDRVDAKASNWNSVPKASVSSSLSARATNGSWRKRQEPTSKEKIPDNWEEEATKASLDHESGNEKAINKFKAPDVDEPNSSHKKDPLSSVEQVDDATRKARALKKKIRNAQALKDKHDQIRGELLLEQQEKVDSLERLIQDLNALGVTDEEKNEVKDR